MLAISRDWRQNCRLIMENAMLAISRDWRQNCRLIMEKAMDRKISSRERFIVEASSKTEQSKIQQNGSTKHIITSKTYYHYNQ